MNEATTITDLDRAYRRVCLELTYQCDIGKISSITLKDDMKFLYNQYFRNYARICGKSEDHE